MDIVVDKIVDGEILDFPYIYLYCPHCPQEIYKRIYKGNIGE